MRPTAKALLAKTSAQAMLVSDLTNIGYLTGLSLSTGLLLALPRAYILFVDARYSEMSRESVRSGAIIRDIRGIDQYMKGVEICAIEEEQVTLSRFRSWKRRFSNTKFVRSSGILEEFRRSKDESELHSLHKAERITKELLRRIPARLRMGMTERALAWSIEQWAYELGADGLSFPPIVAFGTHTSRPHHHPTTKTLTKGHIVQIDIGAKYQGYCADMSRVFFTSPPTKIQEKAFHAICDAKDTVIAAIKPGVSTRKLDTIARSILKNYGMEEAFTHALGHGVGLDIHEGVNLSEKAPNTRLLPGEVITVEPGVYFPGKFGMRVEDMVVVR